jgi:Fic family protein
MHGFVLCLSSHRLSPLEAAVQVHYRLVSIHPFIDGNGRTARLLMNLLLLRAGFTPALIAVEDRPKYLNALEKAQTGGTIEDYYLVIYKAVERTLDIYFEAATGKQPTAVPPRISTGA